MAFPDEVRRLIYTTNATEALNRQLRKVIKTKGSFPSEHPARKVNCLAIGNTVRKWTRAAGRRRSSRSRSTSETRRP
jgi:putative transposase